MAAADADESLSSSEAPENEDSDGELLNPVLPTLVETLTALKNKDPSVYDGNKKFFDGTETTQDEPMPSVTGRKDYLSRYFGPDERLTENEKFLKNYLSLEGWRRPLPKGGGGRDRESGARCQTVDDAEEEKHLDEVDNYERKINFRFEEPGGIDIPKKAEAFESLREKPQSSRSGKKAEKKLRKEKEKEAMKAALLEKRDEKRKEISDRLTEIRRRTGAADEEMEEDGGEPENEWWLCDDCQEAIIPGRKMYHCDKCDFTRCKKCHAAGAAHEHPLAGLAVPSDAAPPEKWKRVVEKIKAEEQLEMVLDEKCPTNFEDVVAGLPVLFKYHDVPKPKKKLSVERILRMRTEDLRRHPHLPGITHDGKRGPRSKVPIQGYTYRARPRAKKTQTFTQARKGSKLQRATAMSEKMRAQPFKLKRKLKSTA